MASISGAWPYTYCSLFFFKQKTAYEITYGDWSSDVCSSDLEQRLNGAEHLVVPARAADDHEWLVVFHDQCALQCAARPLSGQQRVGLARHQRVVVAAAVEDEAEISHDDAGAEAAVQAWLEAHHVAILVD